MGVFARPLNRRSFCQPLVFTAENSESEKRTTTKAYQKGNERKTVSERKKKLSQLNHRGVETMSLSMCKKKFLSTVKIPITDIN